MDEHKVIRVYYSDNVLRQARDGRHTFTNRLRSAVEFRGYHIRLVRNAEAARLSSLQQPGFSLFNGDPPVSPKTLTASTAYFSSFWRIERSEKPWEREIASLSFPPPSAYPADISEFSHRLREIYAGGAVPGRDDGHVFVPLQDGLLDRRDHQSLSSIRMLEETLARTGDRCIIASLHPEVTYDPAETTALEFLARRTPRFTVVRGEMERYLPGASMVVCQDSTAALIGYLLHKPTVLFANVDFHHIAQPVSVLGLDEAFERARTCRPDYDGYVYWFFREEMIDVSANTAADRIRTTLRRRGWLI